jgi:hypothetical protein
MVFLWFWDKVFITFQDLDLDFLLRLAVIVMEDPGECSSTPFSFIV